MEYKEKINLAKSSKTPKETLGKIVDEVYENPYFHVSSNGMWVIDTGWWSIRFYVAKNSNVSKKVLKKLATDDSKFIRKIVLGNHNVDDEIKEIVKNTNRLNEYLG